MSFYAVSLDSLRFAARPAVVPLIASGRFDRAAIMRKAVQIARSIRGSSLTWVRKMSLGLKQAWKQARQEQDAACATVARVAADSEALPVREPRPIRRRVRTWTSGARIHSHGW